MNAVATLGELFGIPKEEKVVEESSSYFLDRSKRCQAVQHVGVCGNPIKNNGVNDSGFCEECWTVDIVTAHELYRECRKDGMTREEAIVHAMINTKDSNGADVVVPIRVKKARHLLDNDERMYESIGNADPNFRKSPDE